METLLVWISSADFHRSQELEVFKVEKRAKYTTNEVDAIGKRLRLCDWLYHPRKANVIVDDLSQKGRAVVCGVKVQEWRVLTELKRMNL